MATQTQVSVPSAASLNNGEQQSITTGTTSRTWMTPESLVIMESGSGSSASQKVVVQVVG